MPKKYVPKIAIPARLTLEQLRAKIKEARDKGKITAPSGMMPFEISGDDTQWDHPEFTYVGLDGISFRDDEIGVDGEGKEVKYPGGATMRFNWAAKGIGFGQFRLTKQLDGKLVIDTEGCGKEFFAKALCALVNQATDSHEEVLRRMKKAKSYPQVH